MPDLERDGWCLDDGGEYVAQVAPETDANQAKA